MKHHYKNSLAPMYGIGFYLILALPLLSSSSLFLPPDWGKAIAFRIITTLLLLVFCWQWLFKKQQLKPIQIYKNPLVWALICLMLTFIAATFFSVDPLFSIFGSPSRGGGVINLLFFIIFSLLIFITLEDSQWQTAWNITIGTAMLVCIIGIIQYYGLFNHIFLETPDRPPSTIGNPIFLAIYLLLLFFVTLAFFLKTQFSTQRFRKIWYGFCLGLFIWTILITVTRAAYLGLLIAGIYFFLFYSKKFLKIKLTIVCLALLLLAGLFMVNASPAIQNTIGNQVIISKVSSRVSLKNILADQRFSAWKISWEAFKHKPLLGWGPENFHVAFDQFYDSRAIAFTPDFTDWWDRAHNIFLDIAIQAGIFGLIAYFALFGILFFKLQQAKYVIKEGVKEKSPDFLVVHALQTTLLAYLIANLFSFDSFATYLIFFFLIAYSLHLTGKNLPPKKNSTPVSVKRFWKKPFMAMLALAAIIFLWHYNLTPLSVNGKIQTAKALAQKKQCDSSLQLMEKAIKSRGFLDAYVRIEYVNLIKTCATFYPQHETFYAQKGIDLMQEAVTIQPLYSRLWIFLGSFKTVQANLQEDTDQKNQLIKDANAYFDHATTLTPQHQEIWLERLKTDFIAHDYAAMEKHAKECINLNDMLGNCYWHLGIAQLLLRQPDAGQQNLQKAREKGFGTESLASLNQLAITYATLQDYSKLASVYEKMAYIDPSIAKYHSSLAFIYRQLGKYQKAREEALLFLKLKPEAKEETEAFLNSLPQ